MRRGLALVLAGLTLAWLGGCASLLATDTRAVLAEPDPAWPRRVELSDTPFHPQAQNDLCGPESLAAVLGAAGLGRPVQELSDWVYLPGRGGALQPEMLAAARRAGALAVTIEASLSGLLRELVAGHPVVVLQNLGLNWAPSWHYAVAIGYDLDERVVILRSGPMARQHLAMSTFELTWNRSQRWAFVALPPGQLPVTAARTDVLSALIGFERVAAPAQAEAGWRSALQRWPQDLALRIGLGTSLYAQQRYDEAASAFSQAAREHDRAAAYNNLARTELARGRLPEAEAAARRAVARAVGDDAVFLEAAQATLQEVLQRMP